MRFDDLTFDQTMILADAWLSYGDEQRTQIAAALEASEDYIARMLRQYRNIEEKRRAQQRQFLTDLLGGEVEPPYAPAPEPEPEPAPIQIKVLPAPEPPPEPAKPAKSHNHVTLNAAVFDIECTDFGTEGYSGVMVCCCVLPLDGGDNVTTLKLRYEEHTDDRRLVRETIAALSQYDILIGHNVAAFDLNWLHSRWLFHDQHGSDVGDWPRWVYADTYQMAKATAIKTRKGLGNLGDYFGLEGEKTSIYRTSWNNVRSMYRREFDPAMADIVYHCEQDVILNRNLWDRLWIDALSMRANPLKVSKWGYIPGCRLRGEMVDPEPPARIMRVEQGEALEAAA